MLLSLTRYLLLAAMILASGHMLIADEPVRLVRSSSPDWPQWRGPYRNGVCEDKGLLGQWPDTGPTLEWSISGMGGGYASPIVVGDTIYIPGDTEEKLRISAVSLEGKIRWQTTNGLVWTRPYPGARAACCYDNGHLYHMNAHGRLACLEAANGNELWAVDVLDRFQAKNIIWGISESVLVDRDRVFVTPAGTKGLMAALDKNSGETLWASEPIDGEQAAYASPILLDTGPRRLLINSTARHAFAVDSDTGELCWQVRQLDPDNTITTTPILAGDGIVLTNASRNFGSVLAVSLAGKQFWSADVKTSHGGAICVGDSVYLSSSSRAVRGWARLDAKSGAATVLNDQPTGSLIYADQRFYCLTERGQLTLQKLDQDKFVQMGSMQLAEGRDVWAHPVICQGRLLLRYHDTLYCFNIRQ